MEDTYTLKLAVNDQRHEVLIKEWSCNRGVLIAELYKHICF